ncbi:hypothetical protein RhiirA5_405227 [Rhizophagus irregularis]|uniref:Uncharacterized protein n=1 Tax=Rhizophagus irregularis TaxID=588596 RepID=A0A2N0QG58_9GLOM|nr:hypothetical protein RhiirA5_405227 [Rhizophagus irregularis]GET50481.1 hypothetical protein RIR_e38785_A0A2N0QG58_9GLOM [Rhizophagus irregularis DAOM 181602=DAOM 197198]
MKPNWKFRALDKTTDDHAFQVNNSTIESTLLTILTKYNISFSFLRLFISDSAANMKK